MKRHYKEMIIIALVMSALVNIVVWGEEIVSENGSSDQTVPCSDSVSIGDVILLQPIAEPIPEPIPEPIIEPIPEPVTGVSDPQLTPEPKGVSNNEPESDPDNNSTVPAPDAAIQNPTTRNVGSSSIDADRDNYWRIYSVSVDTIKIDLLRAISNNTVSINEVIKKNAKDQRDIKEQLSRISARDADYQARVLYYMARLAKLVSGNGSELLGFDSASINEVKIALSLNDLYEVSQDLIDYGEVSENNAGEPESISADDVEVVSDDKISDNSVSQADIAGIREDVNELHEDLRNLFIVNIFSVLFLALLTAGQLEQIIFKRLRG